MTEKNRTLAFDPDHGSLTLGPLRYLLLRPETLSDVQKGVEDRLGPKSAEYLYAAGASWAVGALRRIQAATADSPVESARAFCQHATELGWGRFKLRAFDPENKKITVQVSHSAFAGAYGQGDEPVCHLIAGAIGGLAEELFQMPSSCLEEMCQVQGNPSCLFVATGHDIAGKEAWSW